MLIDVALAAAVAGAVLILVPGLAIVGLLALLALITGAAWLVIDLRQARRRPESRANR